MTATSCHFKLKSFKLTVEKSKICATFMSVTI